MNTNAGMFVLLALSAGAGCVDSELDQTGNDELGIARFSVDESPTLTTIHGFDAQGQEAARVELIHGYFELTGIFKDDYPGITAVNGRKLDVTIAGNKEFVWETMGYDPTMHMPRDKRQTVAALLDDPHVKAPLADWNVGFGRVSNIEGVETEYSYGTYDFGYNQLSCHNSTTCGTARGGLTINTCGGGAAANRAFRGERTVATNGYDEYLVAQCCPSGSGGQSTTWFATKTCPTTGSSGSAVASTCGTASAGAACKACGGPIATYNGYCDTGDAAAGYYVGWSYYDSSSDLQSCRNQYSGGCNGEYLQVYEPCHMQCYCDTFSYTWMCN